MTSSVSRISLPFARFFFQVRSVTRAHSPVTFDIMRIGKFASTGVIVLRPLFLNPLTTAVEVCESPPQKFSVRSFFKGVSTGSPSSVPAMLLIVPEAQPPFPGSRGVSM